MYTRGKREAPNKAGFIKGLAGADLRNIGETAARASDPSRTPLMMLEATPSLLPLGAPIVTGTSA